jgi:hypothetical protein
VERGRRAALRLGAGRRSARRSRSSCSARTTARSSPP